MQKIMTFTASGSWGPGDDYQISLVTEKDTYYLRGKRIRKDMPGQSPQIVRHSIKVSPDWVTSLLSELQNANITALPPEALGCDGEFYSLSVGSPYGGATYSWWSAPPDGWEIFPKVARKIMDEFSKDLPE